MQFWNEKKIYIYVYIYLGTLFKFALSRENFFFNLILIAILEK